MKELSMNKLLISGLALGLTMLLTACSPAATEPSFSGPAIGFEAPAAPGDFAGGESFVSEEQALARDAAGGFATQGETIERLVISNAFLSMVVPDPSTSVNEIAALARELGGFVVSSNVFRTTFTELGVTADQASITIRVPSERMDEALETIKEGATEVRNENVTSDDVTQEFTDLESRLRNLQAAEEQLLDIMNNAEKTEDVLSVFNQLTQIRAEIEVIQGRIQYLSESARLSAISVDLIPDVAAQPLEIGGWRPEGTVKEAFTALIQGLRFLGNAAIYVLICGLPIGLILGVPGFFASRAMRRRRAAAKRKATPTKD
jgi:hypothetical protein